MILTNEEIRSALDAAVGWMEVIDIVYARAIEAAIFKKIGEPVAWHHEVEGLSYENHYRGNVPLYKLPEMKE